MRSKTIAPFASNLEYLSATFDYLLTLARERAAARRRELARLPATEERWEQEQFDELLGAKARAPHALHRLARAAGREAQARRRALRARTALTRRQAKVRLPLEELAAEYGLDEFEKLTLAAVLGPDVDHGFRRALETVGGSRQAMELHVILDLLCATFAAKVQARQYFISTGRLFRHGLLNLRFARDAADTESDFQSLDLRLPRRIGSLLLGEADVDQQVATYSSVIEPQVELEQVVLPPGQRDEVLQLLRDREAYLRCRTAWGFDRVLSYGKGTVCLFSGPPGTGKTMLAHALAKRTGYRLMLVDIRKVIYHSRNDFEENLQRLFREAQLQHAILFFDEADEMFTDRSVNGAMPAILREFENFDGVCILATNRRQVLDEALDRRILYRIELTLPPPALRAQIWRNLLPPAAPLAPDVDCRALAEEFEFAGGHIKNAVLLAVHRVLPRQGAARRIAQADLRAAARLQLRSRLETHTDQVAPLVTLADVVLPPAADQQVRALLAACRKRSTVYTTWGFGQKMSLGKAVTALFHGPSGTGKTMTAEAIAGELGQRLHVVRLSGLISCYVGDTGKNLTRLFDEARQTQALLLIDEADALFAARLSEASHHATYHNQQVDTLLREIERHDGIVILCTNRAEAFDPAFERRLRYRIAFPAPDQAGREAIWRSLVPAAAPLAPDVDFAALAGAYEFTGGAIKNVLLRAAFLAACDGQVLTMALLRQAADQETPLRHARAAVAGFAQAM